MSARSSSIAEIARALTLATLSLAASGCGRPAAAPEPPSARSVAHPGKPPLALVAREGDPAAGVAAAVVTDGIDPARSTTVAWALATLLTSRLPGDSVVAASDGLRVRGRAPTSADATRFFRGLREALAAPVTTTEADNLARAFAAAGATPDPASELSAACRGTALPRGATTAPGNAASLDRGTLESWRKAAYALGRVSFAVVGSDASVKSVDELVARDVTWPASSIALRVDRPVAPGDQLYVRSTGGADVLARIDVAVPTATSAEAVALAASLGAEGGALGARLSALDRPATLALVSATAHPGGGCVSVTVTVPPNDVGGRPSDVDLAARIGTAVAVTTEEIDVEASAPRAKTAVLLSEPGPGSSGSGEDLARREGDAREAADLAAWWALADTVTSSRVGERSQRMRVVVGVAADRDVSPAHDAATSAPAAGTSLLARVGAEVDRARAASDAPAVEPHAKVERGQGEIWVLVGRPCAGADEATGDAGLAAAVTMAETASGEAPGDAGRTGDVRVEPFVALDGVGVLAHDHVRAGESPVAAARRVADAAARRFAATPLDSASVARARSALFAAADTVPARALATVAQAVSPGRPSWLLSQGTAVSLGRASDAEVTARATALRTGALRMAILAGDSEEQIIAARQAADRWMLRRPEGDRACPRVPMPPPPRPGTYTLPLPRTSAASEAWLALPLPDHDRPAFAGATWLAEALDGPGGLLDRALVTAGLVRAADARVLGTLTRGRSALVIRLQAPPGSLDAAVAQTRVLLDRLREGALTEVDLSRASQRHRSAGDTARITPRGRLIELFREGDPDTNLPAPTLLSWRAFAASAIKDDALVIVVAHPVLKTESAVSAPPATPAAPTAGAHR